MGMRHNSGKHSSKRNNANSAENKEPINTKNGDIRNYSSTGLTKMAFLAFTRSKESPNIP